MSPVEPVTVKVARPSPGAARSMSKTPLHDFLSAHCATFITKLALNAGSSAVKRAVTQSGVLPGHCFSSVVGLHLDVRSGLKMDCRKELSVEMSRHTLHFSAHTAENTTRRRRARGGFMLRDLERRFGVNFIFSEMRQKYKLRLENYVKCNVFTGKIYRTI